ncbi:MAG TPA: hypothetical protein VNS12_10640 [Pelagibacterium sp.]|uniref:hypothetical protein n=1 Tax=Pelagibacterium sp. TaxID=1967288 RepID=UPI002CB05E8B|nr:hypothetical protein [Pelagibacterium sp.]HWJ88518.1 hypothetical protein [Pelagibacterium sp.]
MKYDVLRQHIGDKRYAKGDVREAEPRDVAHLIKAGILAEQKTKKEPAPKNKAEPAPKNKADAKKD